MASSPQGIYAGLKTEMKNAYYTETMVDNLENFRTEASAYLSGPGEYEDLTFLKICKNLEGHGHIGYNNLEILKILVKSTTGGKEQLLHMINNAEKEIQESLSGSACCLPQEMGAQKPKLKDEAIVVSMKKKEYRVKEGDVAFLDCTVEPQPKHIIWEKGDKNRVDIRIPLNSQEYYCTGPPNPTLVIRSAKKEDTAYYQCTAKDIDTANNIEIEVKGVIVPLIVASGASGSDGYRNDRSRSRTRDRHRESRSRSPEDMYQGEQTPRELTMQIRMSGCEIKFTIIHHDEIDLARLASIVTQGFVAGAGEKRLDTVDFERKCIRVLIKIKGASSLSEAPAVCLAEQFKHYILDVGLQLSEESNAILEVDESSIEITPEHMPEDGHPLVNITHQEFSVPNSEAVILQTYIISSPTAWSIEWFQIKTEDNEISLEINSKKYYGGSELSPSLIIRNVNVDDQGWYICRATNNNGTGCSNKTFVRINNEPAGTEDKPGILVKDTSDIQEPAGTEDKPGILVKDTSDIQEPAGTEDKPGILVKDTSDIQESTRAEDKPGKLVTVISDIPESTRVEDKPGKLVTDISDIPDFTPPALGNTSLKTEVPRSTPSDSSNKDNKYPAEKGFPADVMSLLSEKYKTEERLIVPTTSPKDKTVFIVYDRECVSDKHQTDFGQEVLFRNPKAVNAEAMQVNNFCEEKGFYISKEERSVLKKFITENYDTLNEKHRNINAISMSPAKSTENGKHIRQRSCVVIYCSSKGFIPFGENVFPKTLRSGLESVDTDIREGVFVFGPGTYPTGRSSSYHQQLRMGCQYAVEGKPMHATIGPFVKLNGNMAFLTCAHAIYGIDSNGYSIVGNSMFVEQPPSTFAVPSGNQFNFRCGEVKKAVFSPHAQSSVDAAVVLISDPTRLPNRGEFAMDHEIRLKNAGFDDLPYFDSGKIHVDPSTIDGDKRIVKFGAETHATRGYLIGEGAVISLVSTEMGLFGQPSAKVTMKNQMEISGLASHGAFFQPGDSGAGVFYVDKTTAGQELTCIGIAIGATSYGNAIVTPIKDVLDALQLPSLCHFP